MARVLGIFLLVLWTGAAWATISEAEFAKRRAALLEEIRKDVGWTQRYTGRAQFDPKVMGALGKVPREKFVPEALQEMAYENRPLPIGYGQTISQPYIVALMTDLLDLKPGQKALEIGTGSGYQAAILAQLTPKVFTIEIIPQLGEAAHQRLRRLGYQTVQTKVADGYFGWKEHAPFDVIIVTAAASHVPPPLLQQLKPGGRMIIPIGTPFSTQQLMLVQKDQQGKVTNRQILPVRFVPFKRKK